MRSHKKALTVALILFALVGIAARTYTLVHMDRHELCGADFPVFYGGGKLVGSPSLYSAKATQEIERSNMGCSSDFAVFIRLPFFAVLMKPWSLLPFWPAFWLFRAASVIAIGIFIWLWPAPRVWSLVACAWSLPLHAGITSGQDVAFLLMWLAVAVVLLTKGWDFAAGCALAMCATKFHLFILLPLLLIYRRTILAGWLTAGAAIAVLCFAAAGAGWPKEFLGAIGNNLDVSPNTLPNLRGLTDSVVPLEVLLAISVVAAAFYVIHYGDFWCGLSAILTGGLLLSHHIVGSDPALLIPVAMMLVWHPQTRYSRIAAICLVSPLAMIVMTWIQVLAMLALLYLLAYEVWSHRRFAEGGIRIGDTGHVDVAQWAKLKA